MTRTIRLNRVGSVLSALEYPIDPAAVGAACDDVTVRLADGEVSLEAVIGRSTASAFVSPEELTEEVMSLLPRRAVGEPFQSDGDA